MMRSFTAFVLMMVPAFAGAGEWLTSYSKAYETAKASDKPIFVHFTNSSADANWKTAFDEMESLTDAYVLLLVDKAADQQDLFTTFEIAGEHGTVVIDRSQQWQYFRTSKKLEPTDLKKVLTECKQATGKPNSSVLKAVSQTESETVETFSGGGSSFPANCPNCRRFR